MLTAYPHLAPLNLSILMPCGSKVEEGFCDGGRVLYLWQHVDLSGKVSAMLHSCEPPECNCFFSSPCFLCCLECTAATFRPKTTQCWILGLKCSPGGSPLVPLDAHYDQTVALHLSYSPTSMLSSSEGFHVREESLYQSSNNRRLHLLTNCSALLTSL